VIAPLLTPALAALAALAAQAPQASQAPMDACAPVAPAAVRDPAAAEAYRAVGDDERAAGRLDSAALAYRAALEQDPSLAPARQALAGLCAGERRDDAFGRGLARVRAGDCRGALPALDEARAGGDPAASLLAGLCRYRLGEDEAATAALREAAVAPDTRAAAELYLGLLALRGGRPGEASPLFLSATADPALAPVARELARAARREGRVVVSILAEAGWDSNAELKPGGALAPAGAADAVAGLTGLVTVAPWRERGPYVRAAAGWQTQPRHHDLDLLALGGAAGVPLGSARRRLLLEYGYDDRRVGGAPWLSAHRLLVEGRAALGEAWSAGAAWSLRGEHYRQAGAADDSGLRQAAQLDAAVDAGGWRLAAAAQGAWHGARAAARAYREAGPLLAVSTPAAGRLRALLEVAYTWREYQAADPGFERRRRDAYADAAARLELELRDRWTAYLSVAARRAGSNVAELRYGRMIATAGLAFTAGGP
jgi:hypothetical protein